MKFNEPVRPAGIGRKQVAFDINVNPSELSMIEDNDNTEIDVVSSGAQSKATLAETMKLARVAAYSAASSAIVQGYNEVWGIKRVKSWLHEISPHGNTGTSFVHWDADPRDEAYNIVSSLAYVDAEDPTIIRVRKKGWYLVNIWFRQTAWSHNNSNYTLIAFPVDSSDSFYTHRDFVETDGYPVLRLSTLIGIPGLGYYGEPANPSDSYYNGGGGIKIEFRSQSPGHGSDTYTMRNENVEISCQIIWLRPFENDFTYNFA
jgi:hypothetical protein